MSALPSSIIVCAHTEQRWADLVAALDSLRRQTVEPGEIIVVIDHNPALLERARAQVAAPGVAVVENGGAPGLSGARNSGLARASGTIIAFLDDDAVAEPDWLATLLAAYTDERVLGVGGAIAPLWATARPRWFPAEFGWVVGCGYTGQPTATTPVRNLIGTNMSFRRAIFATLGGFRDGLGRVGLNTAGCEETELCIRALQRWPDARIIFEPQARVHHRVPAARTTWHYFRARCHDEGRSKATVAALVGQGDGLATERDYTMRTLPRGVLRGIGATVVRRNPAGFLRAGAIVAGLAYTTAGYLGGMLTRKVSHLAPPMSRMVGSR